MKYKILIGLMFFISCTNKKQNNVINNSKSYTVQLEGFDTLTKSILVNSLNNKTFSITGENINPLKKSGNTFYINKEIADTKNIIKVKNISKDSNQFLINITFFKNEKNKVKQYFNPGNFDLYKLDEKEKVEALKKLIIKLTYK